MNHNPYASFSHNEICGIPYENSSRTGLCNLCNVKLELWSEIRKEIMENNTCVQVSVILQVNNFELMLFHFTFTVLVISPLTCWSLS